MKAPGRNACGRMAGASAAGWGEEEEGEGEVGGDRAEESPAREASASSSASSSASVPLASSSSSVSAWGRREDDDGQWTGAQGGGGEGGGKDDSRRARDRGTPRAHLLVGLGVRARARRLEPRLGIVRAFERVVQHGVRGRLARTVPRLLPPLGGTRTSAPVPPREARGQRHRRHRERAVRGRTRRAHRATNRARARERERARARAGNGEGARADACGVGTGESTARRRRTTRCAASLVAGGRLKGKKNQRAWVQIPQAGGASNPAGSRTENPSKGNYFEPQGLRFTRVDKSSPFPPPLRFVELPDDVPRDGVAQERRHGHLE